MRHAQLGEDDDGREETGEKGEALFHGVVEEKT